MTGLSAQTADTVSSPKVAADTLWVDTTGIVTYRLGLTGKQEVAVDTGVAGYQYYDPAFGGDFSWRNTGNTGSPAGRWIFSPERKIGFDIGLHQFDLYIFQPESLPYFESSVPYSRLFMLIGLKKEQMFSVEHHQSIGAHFNFGFHFRRYDSDGIYTRQEVSHNDFGFTSGLSSGNLKYQLDTRLLYSIPTTQENGGVANTAIFDDTLAGRKSLISTELSRAFSRMRVIDIAIRQSWNEGRIKEYFVTDSTSRRQLHPEWTFYHEVGYRGQNFEFSDQAPVESYYDNFYYNPDSSLDYAISYRLFSDVLSNEVGIEKSSVKDFEGGRLRYHSYLFTTAIQHRYIWMDEDTIEPEFQNLLLNVSLSSHPQSGAPLLYELSGAYSFMDYNDGDYRLNAMLGYNFGKPGLLAFSAAYSRREADWIYNHFHSDGVSWDNAFHKENIFSSSLKYHLPSAKLGVSGTYYAITDAVYWDASRMPAQLNGTVQAFVVDLQKDFRLGNWGLNNRFVIQLSEGANILRFPDYWSLHTLFFERDLFKRNLLLRTGIDVYYNTNFYGYGYFPLTGQFYVQNDQELKYYPAADFFISIKVKTVRVFLKLTHFDQGLFGQGGYYNFYKYPAADRSFKVGIDWRFFN